MGKPMGTGYFHLSLITSDFEHGAFIDKLRQRLDPSNLFFHDQVCHAVPNVLYVLRACLSHVGKSTNRTRQRVYLTPAPQHPLDTTMPAHPLCRRALRLYSQTPRRKTSLNNASGCPCLGKLGLPFGIYRNQLMLSTCFQIVLLQRQPNVHWELQL